MPAAARVWGEGAQPQPGAPASLLGTSRQQPAALGQSGPSAAKYASNTVSRQSKGVQTNTVRVQRGDAPTISHVCEHCASNNSLKSDQITTQVSARYSQPASCQLLPLTPPAAAGVRRQQLVSAALQRRCPLAAAAADAAVATSSCSRLKATATRHGARRRLPPAASPRPACGSTQRRSGSRLTATATRRGAWRPPLAASPQLACGSRRHRSGSRPRNRRWC